MLYRRTIEFLLVMAIVRNTLLIRQRDPGQFARIDTYALIDIVIVFLLIVLLLCNPIRLKITWQRAIGSPVPAIIFYYVICCLSSLWSIMSYYTAFRAIQYITLFWSVLVLFSFYDASSFYKAEKKFLILGLVCIVLNFGLHLKLYGLIMSLDEMHTNSYTASSAMILAYVIGEHIGKRKWKKGTLKLVGIIAFCFLMIGTSTASFFAVITGCATAFLFIRRPLLAFYVGLLLIIGCLALSADNFKDLLFYGKEQSTINNLTGRVGLWKNYWILFLQSPIWGHGFAIVNRLGSQYYTTNAHNFVFAILLGTGIIGFLTLFWGAYCYIKQASLGLSRKQEGYLGCLIAFVTGIVNAASLAFIGDIWLNPSFVLALLFGMHLIVHDKIKCKRTQNFRNNILAQQT